MIKLLLVIIIGVVLLYHFHVNVQGAWDYGVNLFHFLFDKIAPMFHSIDRG